MANGKCSIWAVNLCRVRTPSRCCFAWALIMKYLILASICLDPKEGDWAIYCPLAGATMIRIRASKLGEAACAGRVVS
jgi:hypothetical protein